MPAAGGINAQLGFAEESTPGTPVTPNRFVEFEKESLTHDLERVEHSGLRPGRRLLGAANYAIGRVSANGDVELVLQNEGQAVWFKHALGAVATTTPGGATDAREHKCTVGDLDGKALTVQVGMADDTGTSRAKTVAGVKVASWKLSGKENEHPVFALTLDGMTATTGTALAAASYPATEDYFSTQTVVSIAGAEVECSEWEISGSNGLNTERYYVGSNIKRQQLEGNELREITGKLTLAFPSLVAYERFVSDTQASIQIAMTGSVIESAIPYSLTIDIPAARFDGTTPAVDGVGLIPVEVPFKVVDDEDTDGPIVVTIVNTDTTA
ncbi:MAG: phage tail tube protein [Solirubrobacteraceae bacterium]|nr:phage tail tube protein [Solirubrobacteraceae bacterium]